MKPFETWSYENFGKLNGNRSEIFNKQKFLKDIVVQYDCLEELASWIEKISEYIVRIEAHIEYLNGQLVDNTPEHVALINDFINDQALAEKQINAQRILELNKKISDLELKLLLYEKTQTNKDINFVKMTSEFYFYSLPDKLIKDRDAYFALDKSKDWIQISKTKYEDIITNYVIVRNDDEVIEHIKKNETNEIFFSFV